MQIVKRTMNWNPRPSAWQEMQARQAQSRKFREKSAETLSNTLAMLESVASDKAYGVGELAAKRAMQRIAAEAKVRQEQAQRLASQDDTNNLIWRNKSQPTSVEAGNTKIDLSGDTITLSDGTRLDITSGRPTGNVMTLADGSRIDLNTGRKIIDTVA